jgi:hypothetical protein
MDYDLPHFTIYSCIYLPLAGSLYACAIYLIFLSHSAPFTVNKKNSDLQMECWVHMWNKVGQSGEVVWVVCRRHGGDRASSPHTPPTSPLAMSTKQPAHRRKGGSVEVVDSKYAVDLATQQSYSENVFLFVPNLIG